MQLTNATYGGCSLSFERRSKSAFLTSCCRKFRRSRTEVGTWLLQLTFCTMATEVQSGDLNSANSSRLEVSIDGLTLSPYSEGEQEQAEMPAGLSAEESAGNTELSGDGEEDDPNSSATIEMKWGFYLVELYGLALRFFKGILYHYTHIQTLTEHKHALALSSLCYRLISQCCFNLARSLFSY